MRLITVVTLSLVVFAPAVFGAVRNCKSYTEPCITLRCPGYRSYPFSSHPYSLLYGCCNGIVYDEKQHICGRDQWGRITLRSCDPCREFRCSSGQCVLSHWACNGHKDCKDGSDEVGCGHCHRQYFRCRNNRCISKTKICDKNNDCGDGSDEAHCTTKSGGACGANYYRCRNDRCVPLRDVCDRYRRNDCGDNSDEHGCPSYYGKKRDKIPELTGELEDGGNGNSTNADGNIVS